MSPRIIGASELRELLPMAHCIEAMDAAMRAVSTGAVQAPVRQMVPLGGGALFAVMPGIAPGPGVYGAKLIGVHPDNPAKGRPAIQGLVLLFDAATGAPLAAIDGAELTAIRTAAASALATRALARDDAATLGIIGTGVQAHAHLEAIACVRPLSSAIVAGRSAESVARFIAAARPPPGVALRAGSLREAAACDIVCTVTASATPVLEGDHVQPGAHVNLVGAHRPDARESDDAFARRAAFYVDSLAAMQAEAGDILLPLAAGVIGAGTVRGEIGALLAGEVPGRASADEVTAYKSLGLVAQDLYAAAAAVRQGLA